MYKERFKKKTKIQLFLLAREIAEQLRALAILAEDQGLVLNIHKMALTVTPGSGYHLLASTGTRYTHSTQANMHLYT